MNCWLRWRGTWWLLVVAIEVWPWMSQIDLVEWKRERLKIWKLRGERKKLKPESEVEGAHESLTLLEWCINFWSIGFNGRLRFELNIAWDLNLKDKMFKVALSDSQGSLTRTVLFFIFWQNGFYEVLIGFNNLAQNFEILISYWGRWPNCKLGFIFTHHNSLLMRQDPKAQLYNYII